MYKKQIKGPLFFFNLCLNDKVELFHMFINIHTISYQVKYNIMILK